MLVTSKLYFQLLTRPLDARCKRIAVVAVGAAAQRIVLDNVTLSVDAAHAGARTDTLEVDTGACSRTVAEIGRVIYIYT